MTKRVFRALKNASDALKGSIDVWTNTRVCVQSNFWHISEVKFSTVHELL